MTLFACADYTRAFARLLTQEPPPVYAHLATARSVLEAGVVSAWLNDPGASVDERIRRALCEHLYSAKEEARLANELKKFEDDEDALLRLDQAAKHLDHWADVATELGFAANTKAAKPSVGKTSRPLIPAGISALISVDNAGPGGPGGAAQWRYLSSVSHVTWHGLRDALERELAEPVQPGVFRTQIVVRAHSVQIQAFCVLRALRNAADAQFRLMGWDDEIWRGAALDADRHAAWLTRAVGEALAARQN